MITSSTADRSSTSRASAIAVALTLSLAVSGCGQDPTFEGVDVGPTESQLETMLDTVGTVERSGPADCIELPYVEDELVVYLSPSARSEEAKVQIRSAIDRALPDHLLVDLPDGSTFPESAGPPGGPVYVLPTSDGLTIPAVLATRAALQAFLPVDYADDVAVDVNHVGPFLPIGTFHPGDTPAESTARTTSSAGAGEHTVLVIDSPAESKEYDAWGENWDVATKINNAEDHKVDFVAAHGAFVRDIIKQIAPESEVDLAPLVHTDSTGVPWPGFLFTEVDLIRSLEQGLGANKDEPRRFTRHYDLINLSLGFFGCEADPHPVLAGELAEIITASNYVSPSDADQPTVFVAAAGNDGEKSRAHYPAAFAGASNPNTDLSRQMVAVGALLGPQDGIVRRACFSNVGPWVTAWAPGHAVAEFPKAWSAGTGLASWSGTSFATAFVTGALAAANDLSVTRADAHAAGASATWDGQQAGAVFGVDPATTSVAADQTNCAELPPAP